MEHNIANVISQAASLSLYINSINAFIKINKPTVRLAAAYARTICEGLPSEADVITALQKDTNLKDKGAFGKITEYAFFNQKPNSSALTDLPCGYDIKSCALKTLKTAKGGNANGANANGANANGGQNAKERQTLTNCGTTKDYSSFQNICDNEQFSDCKYYSKSKNFVLFVRADDKQKLKTFDQLLDQKLLLLVCFDLVTLPPVIKDTIQADYAKIRQCIQEQKVSQKGQAYLHIHPHGAGHGSGNRALGFTSRFITQLVALTVADMYGKNVDEVLNKKGRSVSIKHEYL